MNMGIIRERETAEIKGNLGVYEETAPLKEIVIWGEPGCETVLGQLLPEDVSLFWKSFDVPRARAEFRSMQQIIEVNGAKVIRMKDIIATHTEELPLIDIPKSIDELAIKIKERGKLYYKLYHVGDLKVLDWVDGILAEDVAQYGKKNAIWLNWSLSLSNGLPLSNIMYARDQSNTLGDGIVMSRMRWPIRQPEVDLFRKGYEILGYGDKLINLDQGYFEGGDAYIFNNNCLIGAGVRTSREAISQIYEGTKTSFEQRGIKMFAVINPVLESHKPQSAGEEMAAMHLDTFMMPLCGDKILACCDEVDQREVFWVHGDNGKVEFTVVSNLRDFLNLIEVGKVDISKPEQVLYSTNFLHLGNSKVIVPLEDVEHERVNQEMRNCGLDVIPANIRELVGGYGAVHCMTAAIKRG